VSAAAADAAFLDAFDSGHPEGGVFGHREHLRLAWILICRHGLDAATPEIERRLRDMAAAHVSERRPAPTFAEFLNAEPWLLGPGLARRHYSAELLSSGEARAAWVDPDLTAMPA
jgi:hypothetical protein